MSQGERVKDPKEKKKVPGWSIEEMKERPNIAVEEDTEEMKRWRRLSQSEMDLCWKNLSERMEEEVLDMYQRQRQPIGKEKSTKKQTNQELESGEKTVGRRSKQKRRR